MYEEFLLTMTEDEEIDMNAFIEAYLNHYKLDNSFITEAFLVYMNESIIDYIKANPEEREEMVKEKKYKKYVKKGGKLSKDDWSNPYKRKYEYYKKYNSNSNKKYDDFVREEKIREKNKHQKDMEKAELEAIRAKSSRDRQASYNMAYNRYNNYSRAIRRALKENLGDINNDNVKVIYKFPEERIKKAYREYMNSPIKNKKMNYKEFKKEFIKNRTKQLEAERYTSISTPLKYTKL